MEETNYKQQDIEAITSYLLGKKNVSVSDIMAHSGANRLRVYSILFELEQEGKLIVTERETLGAVKTVSLL
ncbi:MAG: hypothetical protein IJ764_00210 [Bacteroidales bacterium]|nr:hypothetical protein [Bacteroidales bacterium]